MAILLPLDSSSSLRLPFLDRLLELVPSDADRFLPALPSSSIGDLDRGSVISNPGVSRSTGVDGMLAQACATGEAEATILETSMEAALAWLLPLSPLSRDVSALGLPSDEDGLLSLLPE